METGSRRRTRPRRAAWPRTKPTETPQDPVDAELSKFHRFAEMDGHVLHRQAPDAELRGLRLVEAAAALQADRIQLCLAGERAIEHHLVGHRVDDEQRPQPVHGPYDD